MDKTNKGALLAFFTVLLWSSIGAVYKFALAGFDGFIATVYIGSFTSFSLFITYFYKESKIG